jgi:hypothetical protein
MIELKVLEIQNINRTLREIKIILFCFLNDQNFKF